MDKHSKFLPRDLSWLRFNERVLHEAMDDTNPLLERLKFLGIVSSNLDEFFMVRVASLSSSDPLECSEMVANAFDQMTKQNQYFTQTLLPALTLKGIQHVSTQALNPQQLEYVRHLFLRELLPLLTPIVLREPHPTVALLHLSLFCLLAVSSPTESVRYAVIEMPKNFPRVIVLPTDKGYPFLLVEEVVALFASELFRGYTIQSVGFFRLTRAAEMTIDEEKDEDFAKVMKEALQSRRSGEIMRLELVAKKELADFLMEKLSLPKHKIFKTEGILDFKSFQIAGLFPELKNKPWIPLPVYDFEQSSSVWELLKKKDVLVHTPFESFDAFLRYLSEAANDPDVLAIKQTLYRTYQNSQVVHWLEIAAQRGKQVTVLVELKARFDEEQNIEWAKRLENAGATVLYGIAQFKTHSKACLVIRREAEGIQRYVHLSTGNYNERTAQLYSDLSLFSSQEALTADISAFFNVITGVSQPIGFLKIEMAPYGLRHKLIRLIHREVLKHSEEKQGQIIAKMNALTDSMLIEELYKASQKGVKIKLNVRGICCLRPGVKGISENIEVLSLVDMFLEHSRIFYFKNGGDEEIYLSSADWMPRNLDRRIEILFPIQDEKHKKALGELLKSYFKDNQKAWNLLPDGHYEKKEQGSEKKFRVQEVLCQRMLEREKILKESVALIELRPQKPK
jgi:polyphosphate kinase